MKIAHLIHQLSSSNIRTSGNNARISSTITVRRRGSFGSSFSEIKVETEKTVDQELFITLLAQYKKLEEDIVALAGMAEDDCYRQMLVERLGLNDWGLIEGGSAEPA